MSNDFILFFASKISSLESARGAHNPCTYLANEEREEKSKKIYKDMDIEKGISRDPLKEGFKKIEL